VPSLQEYLLVSPADGTIEIQRRSERGVWEIHLFEAGQVARVESLSVDVSVDEVFADPLARAT
jgi:Uma2 family endonuclease